VNQPNRTLATLHINFRGLKKEFTTENLSRTGERIDMRLVSGPFRSLDGSWLFTALSENACKVELSLRYQFASALLARIAGPVFQDITDTFVDAFVRRADEKFGSP
jgi:ribosome-associated toxin RatA of RatAB toxin-antitoxin module